MCVLLLKELMNVFEFLHYFIVSELKNKNCVMFGILDLVNLQDS